MERGFGVDGRPRRTRGPTGSRDCDTAPGSGRDVVERARGGRGRSIAGTPEAPIPAVDRSSISRSSRFGHLGHRGEVELLLAREVVVESGLASRPPRTRSRTWRCRRSPGGRTVAARCSTRRSLTARTSRHLRSIRPSPHLTDRSGREVSFVRREISISESGGARMSSDPTRRMRRETRVPCLQTNK